MLRLGIDQIYGAPGIVVAEVFSTFPHALMILITALTAADARLYEAADSMGTTAARKFFTITLPGAKYGLISAALVTFTLVITDFGIPKVIGGSFNVLATDVFKLVIGQQDFQKRRRGRAAAARSGRADLRRRPLGEQEADRDADRARRALLAQTRAVVRRHHVGVLRAGVRADPRDARHGRVRVVRELLALQPQPEPAPLHDGPVRCRGRRGLRQQPGRWPRHRGVRRRAGVRRCLHAREDARPETGAQRWCACWRCCRWRCPGWCWAWATSSSSMRRATR